MLTIQIGKIPPEGTQVDEGLDPAGLHLEGEDAFALVPGGRLRCRVERGDGETVHVFGHLAAGLGLECHRCTRRFEMPVEQELDLFYLPHREDQPDEDEVDVELSDRDMVVAYYRGERIDLGELVREQLLLSLPMKPLCAEACQGLCPSCGQDRNQAPCSCPPETDLRLMALKDLLSKGSE